jgi:hypothetical protein
MNESRELDKIKKIREYIMKSGYPLEIEIGGILRKNGWLVINQWPYFDKETKKVRTVDILAMKTNSLSTKLGLPLLIECKKSEKHEWVFHTQLKENEFLPLIGTLSDVVKKITKPAIVDKLQELLTNASIGDLLGLDTRSSRLLGRLTGLHVLNKNTKIGVFNVVPNSKNDFFEATQQINSDIENLSEALKTFIIFPVIVFDGDMYEFYEEGGEMKVLPINHVQHILFGRELSPYLIDVVKKSYFSEFLKTIEADFQVLAEIASYEREVFSDRNQPSKSGQTYQTNPDKQEGVEP